MWKYSKWNKLIDACSRRQLLNWMPDALYLSLRFKIKTGYTLNIKEPVTFNEKLQWLKIYNRESSFTQMVDKNGVKEYIRDVIGDQYVIPNVGGPWNKFEEINFDLLPDKFVLKCTHDSGGTVICTDKSKLDKKAAKKKICNSLKHNYFWQGREWPYKNVKPQIIAEKYIGEIGKSPTDYKLMCFNGKVKCSFTVTNRFSEGGIYVNFYDSDWKPMAFSRHYPRNPVETVRPKNYEKMVELAEVLSKGIPFVRVDFYEIKELVYFGELTFFPGGGMEEFDPFDWDEKLGSWLKLPQKKVIRE